MGNGWDPYNFYVPRGISKAVKDGRPYIEWDTSKTSRDAIYALHDGVQRHQRAHVTKVLNNKSDESEREGTSGRGIAITRHVPERLRDVLPRIYPELKPLEKVMLKAPDYYWHGIPLTWREYLEQAPAAGIKKPQTLPDCCELDDLLPSDHWARLKGQPGGFTWCAHVGRSKEVDDHRGANTDLLHRCEAPAKYAFMPATKKDGKYRHNHYVWGHEHDETTTSAHFRHYSHDGLDVNGYHEHPYNQTAGRAAWLKRHLANEKHWSIDLAGWHDHDRGRVPDPDAPSMAKRIDIHPDAEKLFTPAQVVFFSIEGCPKADAMLTDGAAVFSVPSVTMWDCADLDPFIDAYLIGKVVVIVCDSDWHEKPEVINQARMCQTKLMQGGALSALVAAPPALAEPDENDDTKQGVDDFFGPKSSGHLEDLRVIGSDCPTDRIHEFVIEHSTPRTAAGNEKILQAISMFSGEKGVFPSHLGTLAHVIGAVERTAYLTAHRLEDIGACKIRREGDISDDDRAKLIEAEIERVETLPATKREETRVQDYLAGLRKEREHVANPATVGTEVARGSLELARDHFRPGHLKFRKAYTITLIDELRSSDRREQKLGDYAQRLHLSLRAGPARVDAPDLH